MKQHEIYSYVYDFISQLMDNKEVISSVEKIILFGSGVRGDLHKKSDIDLFIDVKKTKNPEKLSDILKKEINLFEGRSEKTWHLRGITIPLKVIVGDLSHFRWKNLREEIGSYGKIIYGSFEEAPEGLNHYLLVSYELKKLSQKDKMSLLRQLFGYVSKKKGKEYLQKGLIEEMKGKKIGANVILIPRERLKEIKEVLKKHKAGYTVKDAWLS